MPTTPPAPPSPPAPEQEPTPEPTPVTTTEACERQLYWLAANGHVYEEFNNDICNESHDEDNLIHKSTTENHEREVEFRSDQSWAFLPVKSKPMCIEMYKIISYVYSILCSNAFVEGVISQRKSPWTASRNLAANETIAAELKIRFNSTMTCEDFFLLLKHNCN
ncbi:unnamed protein product [Rotaria socialis]|uniref:Uncharacterized protein n=1 Tax=Rotaria socialis TaxID=392032 RepID=A0A817UDQ7_9BILA|nr:unnamed protein product [Rotaria socialis]